MDDNVVFAKVVVVVTSGVVVLLEHAGRGREVHVHAQVHIVQPAVSDRRRRPCCAAKVTDSKLRAAQK